jgi:hypothetical protein
VAERPLQGGWVYNLDAETHASFGGPPTLFIQSRRC